MNKNYIPTYNYICVRKDESEFSSLESVLNEVNFRWSNSTRRIIKAYFDDYNSVTTIVTDNEIEYSKEISYEPKTRILNQSEIQIREKGYHRFVDITLKATPNKTNQAKIRTLENDINKIRNSDSRFQEIENINNVMSRLKCEYLITKVAYDICFEFEVESHELEIVKILCHPIDTKPIFIYDAVIRIYGKILGIDPIQLRNKIEEKLSSYEYLYSELNPAKLEFIKSNGKEEYDGMRLVWYNNQLSSNSLINKRVTADSSIANEIKQLFIQTKESNIATPCIPTYRDAIVYRNALNQIIGYFHICFECSKIESHNQTQMPITIELINKLSKILTPADNTGYDVHAS